MVCLTMLLGLFGGYSISYEGYDSGKYYFGVYGQSVEYGWVVGKDGIYLDTILEKRPT